MVCCVFGIAKRKVARLSLGKLYFDTTVHELHHLTFVLFDKNYITIR